MAGVQQAFKSKILGPSSVITVEVPSQISNRLREYFGKKHSVRLWSFDGGNKAVTLPANTDNVKFVSITSRNKYIVSGSMDKTLRIWM